MTKTIQVSLGGSEEDEGPPLAVEGVEICSANTSCWFFHQEQVAISLSVPSTKGEIKPVKFRAMVWLLYLWAKPTARGRSAAAGRVEVGYR